MTAGHIKPWSVCTDEERLDPSNGLALSPIYDKAFDAGYITFDHLGRIQISSLLVRDAEALGISGNETIGAVTAEMERYLKFHREQRFRE
ncbi:MAG: HNH endonuclease [Ideonella sp.]|nr:HNH endonuclease [Ideonella sp.]